MKTPMQELINEMQKSPLMFASALALIEEMRMLEKEKEAIMNAYDIGWSDGNKDQDLNDLYYFETFNTISLNPTKWSETFNTNQENLPDSTNGYTYYPQENKTVFNIKGK